MVGLPDDRPFVLFTGSSVFIARSENEVPFVRRWIEALRASPDPAVRDAAVLVRPHPFNPVAWITADFSDLGPVAIWPRARYTPAAEESRSSLFDSLYHCQAVVGINTSAMIEAAILGRPVLSLITSDFATTQDGTLHFRYLRPENGGFLRVAGSVEEHVDQLTAVLRDPALVRAETERFVASFIRPQGVASESTPVLADAIALTGWKGSPAAERASAGSRALRVLLWPAAALTWLWAATGDALEPSNEPTLNRVTRVGWHRFTRHGPNLLVLMVRGIRRLPRLILRNIRLARYYFATVVLQREAKDRNL
jgi:hypothetical protein